MYLYKDNFLPESTFKMFNEEMLNMYRPRPEGWWTKHGQWENAEHKFAYESYGRGLSGENFREDAPVLVQGENYPEENDYVRSAIKLGSKSIPDVVRSIKKYMIEDIEFINPLARMMWFQYHSNKHKVIPHFDDPLAGKTRQQSFTSILYMHDTWEDTWGGELNFLNDNKPVSILPKSNRLIIYSRDEEHWVNEITHGIDDYQRMFLFTGWATDNDI